MSNNSFALADVTPILLKEIRARTGLDPVLTHDALIEALLSNPEGAALVGGAATVLKRSESSTAAIMIAQFSKQYTDSNTPPPDIQREMMKGTWSYWSTTPRTSEVFPFDEMVKAMDEEFGESGILNEGTSTSGGGAA